MIKPAIKEPLKPIPSQLCAHNEYVVLPLIRNTYIATPSRIPDNKYLWSTTIKKLTGILDICTSNFGNVLNENSLLSGKLKQKWYLANSYQRL